MTWWRWLLAKLWRKSPIPPSTKLDDVDRLYLDYETIGN